MTYNDMINALTIDYLNVYTVEPEQNKASIIKLQGYVVPGIDDNPDEIPYYEMIEKYAHGRVYEKDREALLKATSVENLMKHFAVPENKKLEFDYRAVVDGEPQYFSVLYIRVSKEGEPLMLVCGFRNTEELMSIQNNAKKELDKQFAIVNALTANYMNVYTANLKDGTAKPIRIANDYELKLISDLRGKVFPFEAIIEGWAKTKVYCEDQERVINLLSIENLKQVFENQNVFTCNYRSLDDGEVHNYQFTVRKTDDEGGVIAGFQCVDDIIDEHMELERKKRELEEAHQAEIQKQTEVIQALSTIYSTIIRMEIDTHDYEVLNSVELMGKIAGVVGNFDRVKENVVNGFMAPEFRESMDEFLELDTLPERMEELNTVMAEYRDPAGNWFESRFIKKKTDEDGRVVEVLYVARDITREKLKEIEQQEQLSHALAAAQQANKAKSTFLNSMSHDIRTPMNAIIGFTALAQTHIDDTAQVQDYLAKISTSSTHLLSLINDILDMSRIESGNVKLDEKPLHMPDLLHDLRTMIQGLINAKNQNLYIDTQDVMHEDVYTDRLRLNQVLINIVGNAIKFTQPGGDIIVRLAEKPCNIKDHTTFEFMVKDNGVGMSKEFQEHIFDTFTREYSATASGIQGTGLGMAITKNIINMMGGEIEVESEVGKGSTFTVTLTLKLASEPVKTEPIPDLIGARALVVDDDLDTCRSVSKMLRDIKMRPDWTASGREAVVRAQDAKEMNDEYKVFIIDYLMPDMNGIETVRRIRKVISDDVPIIVLTAYDWGDFEYEAREAGVTAFVSKPIFLSELREVLTRPTDSADEAIEILTKKYDYSDKHVLLVEDNELNREIATAILEETGMTIDCAFDGDEAVAIIDKAPAGKYDLILMDIQMPKMDGYTATREIRTLPDNDKANIPIVAMTANAFEEDKKKALESGMNGHIIKPVSIESIAAVLDEVFEK